MTDAPLDAPPPATASTRRERLYGLALLTAVYFFYMLDRNAVIVTQELFKAEFGLSDTQVGLVVGIMYGGAYAVAGLPLGALADRIDRPRLLGALVCIWSAATALCGMAGQLWQLLAARAVIGSAESGGAPAALSILGDLLPERRRATASSIFFAGAGLGGIVSFAAGGYIATHLGWRSVFLIYGLPGLLLGLLIMFTIRDPGRAPGHGPRRGTLRTAAELVRDRRLLPVYAGSALFTFSTAGIGAWMIPLLVRSHGMALPTAALAAGLCIGVASVAGNLVGGVLADRAEAARPGGTLLVPGCAALVSLASALAAAASPGVGMAVTCLFLWGLTATIYSGPANAAIARRAPPHCRGVAFAVFAVISNLIGGGLGPLAAGMLSDAYSASLGADAMRYVIATVALVQVGAASCFLKATRGD